VTGAYFALLGSVRHNFSGLLGRGDEKLKDNICKLLTNPNLAIKLGKNGRKLAEKFYDFNIVATRWKSLFNDIYNKSKIHKPKHQFKYIHFHRKWFRMINYIPAKFFNSLINWPSTQELEVFFEGFIKKIKSIV